MLSLTHSLSCSAEVAVILSMLTLTLSLSCFAEVVVKVEGHV
jgi:hypothetical protein